MSGPRCLLIHDELVSEIETEIELRKSSLEVEGVIALVQRLKHHIDAIIDPK